MNKEIEEAIEQANEHIENERKIIDKSGYLKYSIDFLKVILSAYQEEKAKRESLEIDNADLKYREEKVLNSNLKIKKSRGKIYEKVLELEKEKQALIKKLEDDIEAGFIEENISNIKLEHDGLPIQDNIKKRTFKIKLAESYAQEILSILKGEKNG
jgi:hypothetical protein